MGSRWLMIYENTTRVGKLMIHKIPTRVGKLMRCKIPTRVGNEMWDPTRVGMRYEMFLFK